MAGKQSALVFVTAAVALSTLVETTRSPSDFHHGRPFITAGPRWHSHNVSTGGGATGSLLSILDRRRDESINQESRGRSDLHMSFGKLVWLGGIFITLFGQTVMVPGLLLQKMSHKNADMLQKMSHRNMESMDASKKQPAEALPYFLEWRWVLGVCIFAIGHIFCWIGFGMAPQSILACLQCWNIVIAMVLAPLVLNEKVPKNAWTYSGLLGFGCLCVILWGPGSYQSLTLGIIAVDILHPIWIAPLILLVCIRLVLHFGKDYDLHIPQSLFYVVCSATCAWYSATLSRCTSALVVTSVFSQTTQIKLGFAIIVSCFVVMAVAQIHFMNMALKYADAIAIIPLYEGLSMLGQIVFGGILFHEFDELSWMDSLGFTFGVACVMSGLVLFNQASAAMEPEHCALNPHGERVYETLPPEAIPA